MTRVGRGLLLAAIQLAIVGLLGAKLLIDRATLPRVWARTAPVDPDLPVRGRYVRLALEAEPRGFDLGRRGDPLGAARLQVEGGRLVARPAPAGERGVDVRTGLFDSTTVEVVQPLAFFIPEDVRDPSLRRPGERLWAEVTVPRAGPPRPIRLGVSRGGSAPVPIELR